MKSKTLATWLATLGGALGLHRFYLYGLKDLWAWLHLPLTFLGLAGVQRMRAFGQDDSMAALLIPVFGVMVAQGMGFAIAYGLTPDARWDARHNGGQTSRPAGWGAVLGVITALMVGAAILMGSIAFGGQRFFEWQLERERATQTTPPA